MNLIKSLVLVSASALVVPAFAVDIFGVTQGGNLVRFESANPGSFTSNQMITGLASGDRLVGLDFRPRTNQLYALGNSGTLYTINTSTAAASTVATLSTSLMGTVFGFDFNPVPDRIRIVSNTNQNLRVNPDTGAAIIDGTLSYGASDPFAYETPTIGAVAYTNSVPMPSSTQIFYADYALDHFVTAASPNAGTLSTVGMLGANLGTVSDLDIYTESGNNTAFLLANAPGLATSTFHTVNLATGMQSLVGALPSGDRLSLIAAQPVPEPATLAALGLGALAALRRRRAK